MYIAVKEEATDSDKILLNKNARILETDQDGISMLHIAAKTNNTEIAKLFLGKNADVNANDWWDSTPLHEAARHTNVDILALFLQIGVNVDIDAVDDDNMTPRYIANKNKKIEMVKLMKS